MKKTPRRLSILIAFVGIGMLLSASLLHLSSIVGIIGAVMLIAGALIGAFLSGNGENNIGSYHSPRI